LFGGFAVGGAIGLLRRSRSTVLDLGGAIGADIGLALAGVDVDVLQGREHLWSSRPCVFIFNHQSKLDPIIVMKLLREQFTGVAKKEAKKVPVFGQVFQLAGVAFVDRGDTEQAKRALEPAVRKIRDERMSLCIAPEGTRSITPRLSRFKKGPFHIAMQAEVPIVPIVMRNVGEVMWRGAQVVRPGTVEIVVLPPIDTSDFQLETLGEHVEAVRDQFVATLAHWPGLEQLRLPAGSVS
jgi:putative phosphoserine phosphatase / 1-acylglycerol-3-phosphate O-acyltransferase